MWRLLTVLLWTTTFLMLPTWANGFWTPKAMWWLMGSFLLVSSSWWNTPTQSTIRNRWLGYLFCWIILSFGWHVLWPQVHIAQTTDRVVPIPWVWYPILPTLIAVGSLLSIDTLIRHTDILERWVSVAETLCWIGGAISVYALAQWCWLDPLRMAQFMPHTAGYVGSPNAPITTFGNPMLTANFLALCAPCCLMFRPLRFKLLYALMLGNLLLIFSTASLLAVVGASLIFFLLIRDWKKASLGGLAVAAFAWWLGWHHAWSGFVNSQGRVVFWHQLLGVWKQTAPWMGVGLGGMEEGVSQGLWNWASAHNEPLQILFELGIIGVILTGLAIGSTLRRLLRTPMSISLAGWSSIAVSFAVVSCLSFPLRVAPMLAIGVCIWAALEVHTGGADATRAQGVATD